MAEKNTVPDHDEALLNFWHFGFNFYSDFYFLLFFKKF